MKMRATVAYNGSGFHGFAVNRDVRTVAGDLETALATIVGEPVTITCAGRTDKGVHGRGQVISFELPDGSDVTSERIERSLNGLCKPMIVVRDVEVVDDEFDARFSAQWRQYRYQVLASPHPDPLRLHTSWFVPTPLDQSLMNQAAAHLIGEHDFTSFCKRVKVAEGEPEKSMVRKVLEAEWKQGPDDIIEFWVKSTAFCHQMVRSFVGTTVDVGLGRYTPDDIPKMLEAKDRLAAGRVAPPEGLTFWKVNYETSLPTAATWAGCGG